MTRSTARQFPLKSLSAALAPRTGAVERPMDYAMDDEPREDEVAVRHKETT